MEKKQMEEPEKRRKERCEFCKIGFGVSDYRYGLPLVVCELEPVRVVKEPTGWCSNFSPFHQPIGDSRKNTKRKNRKEKEANNENRD